MYYIRRSDLTVQELDEETLLLDDKGECIHQLNRTASFVWHRCDGATSVQEIVRSLIGEFDVDEITASTDVANVIEKLRSHNLLAIATR